MKFIKLEKILQEAFIEAENIAISLLEEQGDFSSFIFSEWKIQKILSDNIDEAIDIAYDEIEENYSEIAIFIYKDIIELNWENFFAIISQIHSEEEDFWYSFALPYKKDLDSFVFLNDRIFFWKIRNALFL